MRPSPIILIMTALLVLAIVLGIGSLILQPPRPLLVDVTFSLPKITPNADGVDDITELTYRLNRNAAITVSLTNRTTGQVFNFRDNERRTANTYRVLFSGIVDGYTTPDDKTASVIETRLIPNGDYQWIVRAVTETGETAQTEGTLTVADGASQLPDIIAKDVAPKVFTPNQDGYDDRLRINVYLVKPADVRVYLQSPSAGPIYIPVRGDFSESPYGNQSIVYQYDYDGGVDQNVAPPPDGDYQLVIEAQDKEGQRVRQETQITIRDGGLPQAEIATEGTGRPVTWTSVPYVDQYMTDQTTQGDKVVKPEGVTSELATISLPQSDLVVFRLTIHNYGKVPLRTIGPWPGTVYQYDQTQAAMLTPDDRQALSGAWRIGIECERTTTSYPWRWAIGAPDQLTKVDRDGETLYYLLPGQKATVWGAVRMTTVFRTRNPQKCWAALIQEDVQIPERQNHVGEISIKLLTPSQP